MIKRSLGFLLSIPQLQCIKFVNFSTTALASPNAFIKFNLDSFPVHQRFPTNLRLFSERDVGWVLWLPMFLRVFYQWVLGDFPPNKWAGPKSIWAPEMSFLLFGWPFPATWSQTNTRPIFTWNFNRLLQLSSIQSLRFCSKLGSTASMAFFFWTWSHVGSRTKLTTAQTQHIFLSTQLARVWKAADPSCALVTLGTIPMADPSSPALILKSLLYLRLLFPPTILTITYTHSLTRTHMHAAHSAAGCCCIHFQILSKLNIYSLSAPSPYVPLCVVCACTACPHPV